MRLLFRIHEWLADRTDWVQYPKPKVRSLSGYPTGWRLRWHTRPRMNRALALCLPTAMLFVPNVGVYLAILCVIFLFAYFRRN
jgi:hypothetical protein